MVDTMFSESDSANHPKSVKHSERIGLLQDLRPVVCQMKASRDQALIVQMTCFFQRWFSFMDFRTIQRYLTIGWPQSASDETLSGFKR
jgi:hypothetical protein